MAKRNRQEIKNLFKNGMKPNEEHFSHIIDSSLNVIDDNLTTNDDKIGIFETDPLGTLHIGKQSGAAVGSSALIPDLVIGSGKGLNTSIRSNEIRGNNAETADQLSIQPTGGATYFHAKKSLSEQIIFKDTGRIGIGTAAPFGPLHINTNRLDLVVSTVGYLGIGTTAPAAPIHVKVVTSVIDTPSTPSAEEPVEFKGSEMTEAMYKKMAEEGAEVPSFGDDAKKAEMSEEDIEKALADEKRATEPVAEEPSGALGPVDDTPILSGREGIAMILGDHLRQNLTFAANSIGSLNGISPSTLNLNPLGGNVQTGSNMLVRGSILQNSDKRLKTQIKPINVGLKQVLELKPVSYKWKRDTGQSDDLKYGFIAQDVEKTLKEVVYIEGASGIKGLSSIEIIPVLVKSIQEQQAQIKAMEARMNKLEKLIQKK